MCDQQRLRPACAYAQSDQILYESLGYSMTVKLPTEHHLEFLSLKGGFTGSSEFTHVKIPHCWKSHVSAHISHTRMMAPISKFISYNLPTDKARGDIALSQASVRTCARYIIRFAICTTVFSEVRVSCCYGVKMSLRG